MASLTMALPLVEVPAHQCSLSSFCSHASQESSFGQLQWALHRDSEVSGFESVHDLLHSVHEGAVRRSRGAAGQRVALRAVRAPAGLQPKLERPHQVRRCNRRRSGALVVCADARHVSASGALQQLTLVEALQRQGREAQLLLQSCGTFLCVS